MPLKKPPYFTLFLIFAVAAPLLLWQSSAFAAASMSCTGGDFGTVNTQATSSGTHNITMSTAGAITYDSYLNGPATGTNIICTFSGFDAGTALDRVRCDFSRTTASTGGCCGTTNRTHSQFTIKGTGGTSMGQKNCISTFFNVSGCCFNVDASGGGTLTLGTTLDATHVTVGGGGYKLSNHGSGPVTVYIRGKVGGANTVVTATADYSVLFNSLVGFSGTTNLDFGNVYAPPSPGAGDTISLGTNGTAVYAGNFSAAPGGTLAAGQVTVNNVQNGVTLEVYCDTTITLAKAGASTTTIQVTGVKVAKEGSTGTYAGAGSACNGSGGAAATTLAYASGTTDQFFFGGKLDGGTATNWSDSGTYSSANAGGTAMTVIVLNQ